MAPPVILLLLGIPLLQSNPYLLQNVGAFSPYLAQALSSSHPSYGTSMDSLGAVGTSAAPTNQFAWMMPALTANAFGQPKTHRSDRMEVE